MSEENRKKEETMEEPTREMEKETGAETEVAQKMHDRRVHRKAEITCC